LEELLVSSLAQTDAQAKLLKGIITQQEFLEMIAEDESVLNSFVHAFRFTA
jgi:hypothetical protein